jgi:putative transcriptional regulator
MASTPVTLEEIRASRPQMDRAKLAATTEDDIRRQQIEGSEDPPLRCRRSAPNVKAIRANLRMTQEAFAAAIAVFLATVRN